MLLEELLLLKELVVRVFEFVEFVLFIVASLVDLVALVFEPVSL